MGPSPCLRGERTARTSSRSDCQERFTESEHPGDQEWMTGGLRRSQADSRWLGEASQLGMKTEPWKEDRFREDSVDSFRQVGSFSLSYLGQIT